MNTLNYAQSLDYQSAKCILFGANTQNAGTAPTFAINENKYFSADFIRMVDNKLFSLPENFRLGESLWEDGNLILNSSSLEDEVETVYSTFRTILQNQQIPICLGGDHLIKYAALKALDKVFPEQFGVIYLDAHPDCELQPKLSYSSILYHGFSLPTLKPNQVMLTGIRQFTSAEIAGINRFIPEIGIIKGSDFACLNLDKITDQIIHQFKNLKYLYFSIDLDGLNNSCAPAVESPYPGGPNLNQIICLIHYLSQHFSFIGMDISEFIPDLDNNHITALSAARLLKEFYSCV